MRTHSNWKEDGIVGRQGGHLFDVRLMHFFVGLHRLQLLLFLVHLLLHPTDHANFRRQKFIRPTIRESPLVSETLSRYLYIHLVLQEHSAEPPSNFRICLCIHMCLAFLEV